MDAEERASRRAGEDDAPMSEEEGESLMKDTGNVVGMDSSDEEDDEDEEEERRVAEGFIVDEDEDADATHKRKRRHRRRETQEEGLDEDDLALLQENQGPPGLPHKRPRQADDGDREADLAHIFDDEEDDDALPSVAGVLRAGMEESGRLDYDDDELDDFIEDDEDEEFQGLDEEQREERRKERREERRKARLSGARVDPLKAGIDPEAWDEIHDIFGNGEDYAWALAEEDEEEDAGAKAKMEYKDVRTLANPDL